jgi:HupE / UreJ protein
MNRGLITLNRSLELAFLLIVLAFGTLVYGQAQAHGISGKDAEFVTQNVGTQIGSFLYLGAKHMVTGYDHILFILGVIFYLFRLRQVALYVTLFSIGHSTTLLLGVIFNTHINPYLIDAIIGLSVAYKAFENLDGFKSLLKWQPNAKAAVLIFGLFHGAGLATKLLELHPSQQGLIGNLVAFNAGVEIGQLLVLGCLLLIINLWRKASTFQQQAKVANMVLLIAGFVLMGYQLFGYFTQPIATPTTTQQSDSSAVRFYAIPFRTDNIDIPLTSSEEITDGRLTSELEYKVKMNAGDTLIYSWTVSDVPAEEFYYDFHGESPPHPTSVVQSYQAQTGIESHGALITPFTGIHGWYFQNQSIKPVVVHLKLAGFYELHDMSQPLE